MTPVAHYETVIDLPAAHSSTRLTFADGTVKTVEQAATVGKGLRVGDGWAYTAFDTCDWMPCQEPPGQKATLTLTVKAPPGYRSMGSFSLKQPYSSYLYGFVTGNDFTEVTATAGPVSLRYWGWHLPAIDVARLFADTPRMLAFLQEKAGVPYPHAEYAQALVDGDIAQEAAGFAVIGKGELLPILADPTEDWVIVHELAHQWWGNLLTCKTWADFWLNEGFAVFMTAAYKEVKWGRPAYDREMALAARRLSVARAAGWDLPLAFPGTYPTLSLKRAVAYSKGALFLDTLRRSLGEGPFWKGVQVYTQRFSGKAVTGRDLEETLGEIAGPSAKSGLRALFAVWVDAPPP